jgi:osmotically-inducible protein OsmY
MQKRALAVAISLAAIAVALPVLGGQADDSELAQKVSDRLRQSATVGHLQISAGVRDGRVLLKGRVRNLFQAWEAANLAGKVNGVLEIENRIDVDSRGPSDATILSAVKRAFEDRPDVAASNLAISVDAGTVALSGKLDDARIRFTAADAAAAVDGVVAVKDRMETAAKDDESIRKAVTAILGPASLVRVAGKIESMVKDGVVTLKGTVPRVYERRRAERLALGVNGVRSVENRLEVKPPRTDHLISLD